MQNMPFQFIKGEFVDEYTKMHRTLCMEFDKILFSLSFLNKAIELNKIEIPLRNNFVLEYLFKNEFELLVLRINRTLFDTGSDTITLEHFNNEIIKKFLHRAYQADLQKTLKDSQWSNDEVEVAKRRLRKNVHALRDEHIAHVLNRRFDNEYEASIADIENVMEGACDFLLKLSYDAKKIYTGKDTLLLNFDEEKKATYKICEDFMRFQVLSAYDISSLSCKYSTPDKQADLEIQVNLINRQLAEHE